MLPTVASSPVITGALCTVGLGHMVNIAQSFAVICGVMLCILVSRGTGVTDYRAKLPRCGTNTRFELRILQHICGEWFVWWHHFVVVVVVIVIVHVVVVALVCIIWHGINAGLVVAGWPACSQCADVKTVCLCRYVYMYMYIYIYVCLCVCMHSCMNEWMNEWMFNLSSRQKYVAALIF
jgi:hypothetical protein